MTNFNHPLMTNNITKADLQNVISFLRKKNPILTQSKNVRKFELEWSKWLNVKYSVFVNSGSSANLLSIAILKKYYSSGEIIVPALTWISDITSVILNGYKPVFVDINLNNLSMNEDEIFKKINKKTRAIFITHAQGFNGLSKKLLKYLKEKKIILIEDVCESHGAKFNKKKLGSFGLISNFSFYYAHHMSTIEGGMICTNDEKIYQNLRMLRSHGLLRESDNNIYKKNIIKKNKSLNENFIFMLPGYNVRNTEIGAVLGLSQLKRLNKNILKRNKNHEFFLNNLNSNLYFTDFLLKGSSNYAFNIVLKYEKKYLVNKLIKTMKLNKIEFRRGNAGGGNQLRQPYIKNYIKKVKLKNFKNVDHVHFFGYYIGNYPSLTNEKILNICKILNSIKFK